MISKTDDEIIEGVLKKCAENPNQHYELSYLISINLECEKDSPDIYKRRISIERVISDGCLLARNPAGYTTNAKTREIVEAGGYQKYITENKRRNSLKDRGEDSKAKYDIFHLKTKWLPYIISAGALIVSILAFLQSGGWICLFKA